MEFVSSHPCVYHLDVLGHWFFRARDASRHQGSSHQIIQLLMCGYPARSLFADKAVLATSIHQRSTTACVRAPRSRPRRSATTTRIASSSNLSLLHDATESASNQSPLWRAEAARNCALWKAFSVDSSATCLTSFVMLGISPNDCLAGRESGGRAAPGIPCHFER